MKSIAGGGLVVGGIVVVLVVGGDELDTGSAIRTLVCGVEEDAGGEELRRHEG